MPKQLQPSYADRPKSSRSLLALLLVLAVSGWLLDESQNQALFLFLNKLFSLIQDVIWINLTNLGSTMAGAALLCLLLIKRPQLVFHIVITGLLCTLAIYGLKHSLDIIRPHLALNRDLFHFIETDITSPARPSGHSATAFFIAGTLYASHKMTALRVAVLLLASLIALSRIAIGVHWPLDLIWGAFVGLAMGYTGAYLTLTISPRACAKKRDDQDASDDHRGLYIRVAGLSLCALITGVLIAKPLPYPEDNLISLILIYGSLTVSSLGIAFRQKK